jgi:hypothetical protein
METKPKPECRATKVRMPDADLLPVTQATVIKDSAYSEGRYMSILVERSEFDPQIGYQYYVAFNHNGTFAEEEVHARVPVEVALSVCENGDLADFSFELPKTCREEKAMEFIAAADNAKLVEQRVYVTFAGFNGDTVALAAGRLELDLTGRIIGLAIIWGPVEPEPSPN